jgi:hypothetical protein
MLSKRLIAKNREASPEWYEKHLADTIVKKIRRRYNLNQELAILRQRDTKPQEYAEYYEYVESCKAEAKAELGI